MLFKRSTDSAPPIVGLDVGHATTKAAIWDSNDDEPKFLELPTETTLLTATGFTSDREPFVGPASTFREDCMLMNSLGHNLSRSQDELHQIDEKAKEGREFALETFFSELFDLIQAEAPKWEGDIVTPVSNTKPFGSHIDRHLDDAGFEVLDKLPTTTAIFLAHHYYGRMLVPRDHRQTGAHNVIVFDMGSQTTDMAVIELDRVENAHIHCEGTVSAGGRSVTDKISQFLGEEIQVADPHPQLLKLPNRRAAVSGFLDQLPADGEIESDVLVASESGIETRQTQLSTDVFAPEIDELADEAVFGALANMIVNRSPFERDDIDLMLAHGQPIRWPAITRGIQRFGGQPWTVSNDGWIPEEAVFPVILNSGVTHAAALGASAYGAAERGDIERPEIEYRTADYS